MNPEPRQRDEYSERQVEAAHRVLVDVGQVLASFSDCMVIVGGWVPDLLLPESEEPHIGSIDVDIALDAARLKEGRYAQLVKLLIATKRYHPGERDFQMIVEVDLNDAERPVQVEVEFLAPKGVKLKKNRPKLLADFRVLQAEGCEMAFHSPKELSISGKTVRGAANTVRMRVASLPDFLVMKALAIGGRDKPKDSYDLCYCLEHYPENLRSLAAEWQKRNGERGVARAIEILQEKFATVDAFGPQQFVEFHQAVDPEERAMQARRAYELVQRLLESLVSCERSS
jgi:hypothetical protein